MQSPAPLKLTKVTLRRLLVMNLKVTVASPIEVLATSGTHFHLHLPELLGGHSKSQLVAAPLVLEPVDALEGLGHGDVEDEVGEGEESDGDPAMAALEARGLSLCKENETQEDEEKLEELVELLLLEVYGALLLQGLLEMELDYGVYGLEGCLFRNCLRKEVGFVVRFAFRH
ncbi:hypothetical protein F2P56_022042 [Juglans regia]|uniref:Uncharacterized protein n=1 Tax=Juglans regia TaxID=51240 RepID=A0A833WNF6_JUGRE|nr:hypothetical protein F2P56_022042 [Juglans regia]